MSCDASAVKAATDLVVLVGEVVSLKRAGRTFKGICPLHPDKDPSLGVDPERQLWRCFGCSKGGDVLTWVMERESVGFTEALRMLAERAGIAPTARRRPRATSRTVHLREASEARTDWLQLVEARVRETQESQLLALARQLAVSLGSLRRLDVAWSPRLRLWLFPMRDPNGAIIGIRTRSPNGRKRAVKGSREGIFLPHDLALDGMLAICEGPTDCAAALDLGFAAIGRPSCTGATAYCAALTRGRDAVIVADRDDAGRQGAEALATALLVVAKSVRVIEPPDGIKDLRDALRAGLTRSELGAAIAAAEPRRLRIGGAA